MAWSVLVGAVINSISTLSPAANASHATNDIDLMIIEDSAEVSPPTLTTAAGYALVTGGSVSVNGPGPAASAVGCSVWWRRWNGSDGNPTVADIGNHLTVDPSGADFVVTVRSSSGASLWTVDREGRTMRPLTEPVPDAYDTDPSYASR